MKNYESPRFDFQELKLFERVADTCWGTAKIWLDTNSDGTITSADININTGGGCKGNDSASAINGAIQSFNKVADAWNSSHNLSVLRNYNNDLANWVASQSDPNRVNLKNITATATSNWANTKETSGGGIIIDPS